MNFIARFLFPPRLGAAVARLAGAALVLALGVPARTIAAAATAAPKTHVLFMGADLSVQRDGKLYRVENISGSDLMIRVGQETVFVPTQKGALGLQVHPDLKLTDSSVQLDEMKSGPAYTPENDPVRKVKQAASNAMDLAGMQDTSEANLMRSLNNENILQHAVDAGGYGQAANQAQLTQTQAATRQFEQQNRMIEATTLGDFGSVGAGAHQMQLAEGQFDAMEVAFKVSSPVEIESPYMVILFRFHDPAAKPGVDGMLIHLQAIDPIDAKPRYIRVLKGGLPKGFKYLDCSVHLYNRGRELASNLSTNRVEMTRSETQQYIVMKHIGGHKGATLAAAAVRGTLPRVRRESLSHDQITRVIYVKVSPDGTPLGIFTNEACELQIDDSGTTAAVGDIFFRPALQTGKPVEGVARVRLADL